MRTRLFCKESLLLRHAVLCIAPSPAFSKIKINIKCGGLLVKCGEAYPIKCGEALHNRYSMSLHIKHSMSLHIKCSGSLHNKCSMSLHNKCNVSIHNKGSVSVPVRCLCPDWDR